MVQVQKNSGWMLYAFLRVISFHNVLLNIIGTNAYNITQGLTGHLACFPSVRASLVAQIVKNLPAMQEAQIRFLGRERSPGEGNEYPLQYSCLENPIVRGAWQATVHGVARVGHNLVTKPPPRNIKSCKSGIEFLGSITSVQFSHSVMSSSL